MRLVFSLLFLFLLNFNATAQTSNHILPDKSTTDIVKKALDHIYNYEFAEASALCEVIRKKYPAHPGYDFMMALNMYWDMFYNDTYKTKSTVFVNHLTRCITLSKAMLEKDPKDLEGVFFKLAGECYLALFYSERDEVSTSVGYARKMYGTMKLAFELRPKLNEFYFPTGLYNYYVVQYPETKPVFKPFMFLFMSGDKVKGFSDMDYAWRNAVFSKMECGYHLSNIYLKYEDKPLLAYEYTKVLHERYPKNLYYAARHAEVLLAKEEYREATRIASLLYKSDKKYFVGISCIFYGLIYEKEFKDYDMASKFYLKAIQTFAETNNPESDYLGFAYAGLGRYYNRSGNKTKATEYYKKCKDIAEYTALIKEANAFFGKK